MGASVGVPACELRLRTGMAWAPLRGKLLVERFARADSRWPMGSLLSLDAWRCQWMARAGATVVRLNSL